MNLFKLMLGVFLLSVCCFAGERSFVHAHRQSPPPRTRVIRVSRPVRFRLPKAPRGGWRGYRMYWGGHAYAVWAWGPWAPFWAYRPYEWHLGLFFYIPEGVHCEVVNDVTRATYVGASYNSSEDAMEDALAVCENAPEVFDALAESACRVWACRR